jgi:hypothetical protein
MGWQNVVILFVKGSKKRLIESIFAVKKRRNAILIKKNYAAPLLLFCCELGTRCR